MRMRGLRPGGGRQRGPGGGFGGGGGGGGGWEEWEPRRGGLNLLGLAKEWNM